jgi:hypothetical protein
MANPFSPVQAISKTSASAASVTTAAVTTTASGSLFIVGIACFTNKIGATPITDSKGNTWTQALGSTGSGANGYIAIFYSANATGGASHTFTFTPTSSDFIAIGVLEVQGAALSSVLGSVSSSTASAASHSSGNITSNATVAEVFFGFGALSFTNEGTPTLSSSLWYSAAMLPDGAVEGLAMAFRFVAPSTTDQFTYNTGAAHNEGVAVAGFLAAATAGSGGAHSVTFFGA